MTNFERITTSPEALAEFLEVPFDNCDEQFREYLLGWLNSEAEKSPLTCGSCPIGKTQRIVGNGITEPPYLQVIRCPYDDKHYKCLDDECTQQAQLEHSAKEQTKED